MPKLKTIALPQDVVQNMNDMTYDLAYGEVVVVYKKGNIVGTRITVSRSIVKKDAVMPSR